MQLTGFFRYDFNFLIGFTLLSNQVWRVTTIGLFTRCVNRKNSQFDLWMLRPKKQYSCWRWTISDSWRLISAISWRKYFFTPILDLSSKSSEKFRRSKGVMFANRFNATQSRSAYSAFPHSCFHGVTIETFIEELVEFSPSIAVEIESSVDNADSEGDSSLSLAEIESMEKLVPFWENFVVLLIKKRTCRGSTLLLTNARLFLSNCKRFDSIPVLAF